MTVAKCGLRLYVTTGTRGVKAVKRHGMWQSESLLVPVWCVGWSERRIVANALVKPA